MGVPEQVPELLKVKSITGTIEVHSIFDKTGISTRLKSLPIPLRKLKKACLKSNLKIC
jgi:hypothetical protein